jgi:hypothetical protein
MNQVYQDNEEVQVGEPSYDFGGKPKNSLFITASLRGEGPTKTYVRLVPKALSLEVKL